MEHIVKYPHLRTELVEVCASLSDADYQRRVWLNPDSAESFDYVVHFLFDDTPLSESPDRCLGDVLVNRDEVDAVRGLCASIDEVLRIGGSELRDGDYIEMKEWCNVLDAAARAHELLCEDLDDR